ncbi:unnamed protein product [Rotaria magnacalcarata]|uniref:SAM domain-containing protein n=3 Tax=Rotaria magnacalcarata TaxID=392030 RepID=A0A815DCY2_9BILA|nr:unnamed protein product [Rotaria magnacalcarata]CAF2073584.1 unnamed protein product [Rotaria magnacalcarata]CAF2088293.1 unnamed protein product [Rotaria magnacalcarata]CAF3965000.1 unnamed protein product [Rotaria magnacalcarata]CAF4262929.1 unnamed protein product [Rotaria magnacalcarata]
MNELDPPPPSYDQIKNPSATENSNPKWQAWYRKFIELKFTSEESNEYAGLFITNDIEISMIPELTDPILRSIGIDKAGHRIRILRLQTKPSTQTTTRSSVEPSRPAVNTPRCMNHPNVAANEKCCRCKRLVCLHCRREKSGDGGRRYFCQNCYDDCTIL